MQQSQEPSSPAAQQPSSPGAQEPQEPRSPGAQEPRSPGAQEPQEPPQYDVSSGASSPEVTRRVSRTPGTQKTAHRAGKRRGTGARTAAILRVMERGDTPAYDAYDDSDGDGAPDGVEQQQDDSGEDGDTPAYDAYDDRVADDDMQYDDRGEDGDTSAYVTRGKAWMQKNMLSIVKAFQRIMMWKRAKEGSPPTATTSGTSAAQFSTAAALAVVMVKDDDDDNEFSDYLDSVFKNVRVQMDYDRGCRCGERGELECEKCGAILCEHCTPPDKLGSFTDTCGNELCRDCDVFCHRATCADCRSPWIPTESLLDVAVHWMETVLPCSIDETSVPDGETAEDYAACLMILNNMNDVEFAKGLNSTFAEAGWALRLPIWHS